MFGGSNTESALEKQQNGTAPDANGALNTLDHAGNHVPATSGATLLPRPVASLVSFFAHSTSLSFRIGAFFGGAAIDGVRVTTLTGLELSRAVIEGVLTRAGRDVAIRSSERGKAEAESLLERSVSSYLTEHLAVSLLRPFFMILTAPQACSFTLNLDICLVLRCGDIPSVIYGAYIGFPSVTKPSVHPRCHSWLFGIFQGNSSNCNSH